MTSVNNRIDVLRTLGVVVLLGFSAITDVDRSCARDLSPRDSVIFGLPFTKDRSKFIHILKEGKRIRSNDGMYLCNFGSRDGQFSSLEIRRNGDDKPVFIYDDPTSFCWIGRGSQLLVAGSGLYGSSGVFLWKSPGERKTLVSGNPDGTDEFYIKRLDVARNRVYYDRHFFEKQVYRPGKVSLF